MHVPARGRASIAFEYSNRTDHHQRSPPALPSARRCRLPANDGSACLGYRHFPVRKMPPAAPAVRGASCPYPVVAERIRNTKCQRQGANTPRQPSQALESHTLLKHGVIGCRARVSAAYRPRWANARRTRAPPADHRTHDYAVGAERRRPRPPVRRWAAIESWRATRPRPAESSNPPPCGNRRCWPR